MKFPSKHLSTIVVFYISLGIVIICTLLAWQNWEETGAMTFILLDAIGVVIMVIVLLSIIFGEKKATKGISDFIIGDEGTYSLSRLQAVIWAVVLISFQVAVMFVLYFNKNGNYFDQYQLVFSESAMWLLGLSLTSYVATKSITVQRIERDPQLYKRKITNPEWGDLFRGQNGLDFSRCQMFIWMIIALVIFESKCYQFLGHLRLEKVEVIQKMFLNTYEEYGDLSKRSPAGGLPYVPFLPWSFIVLMGLSQGAYVGKKLVPDFKLADANKQVTADLQNNQVLLEKRNASINNIILRTSKNAKSPLEQQSLEQFAKEIQSNAELNSKITQRKNDLKEFQ
jgi:hypothetical protein